MNITLESNRVELQRHQLLRVANAQGTRLVCTRGELWITQEHDLDDHFIARGEAMTVDRPGLVIVSALEESGVRIEAPAREPGWLTGLAPAVLRGA